MDLFRNKYLAAPLWIFLAVFALDKIFFLPGVRDLFMPWNKIEPFFYQSRENLFKQLTREYPLRRAKKEKLGLILGTSRAGEFNNADFRRNLPGLYAYNFSAPFACPSYHYYWTERILRKGMKIKFALVEVDPLLFSRQAAVYSLSYSYDFRFMIRNWDATRSAKSATDASQAFAAPVSGFSLDEAETFLLKNLFALYRYPPNPAMMLKNLKKNKAAGATGLELRRGIEKMIRDANRGNLGGIPNPFVRVASPEKLRKEAEKDAATRLEISKKGSYQADRTQVYFFAALLELLARERVVVVLYWPLASKPYRKIMRDRGIERQLKKEIGELVNRVRKKYPGFVIRFVDPENDAGMNCRNFADSFHLSGRCYPLLTDTLLRGIAERLN